MMFELFPVTLEMGKVIEEQNYPIMFITACGHFVRVQCLKKKNKARNY